LPIKCILILFYAKLTDDFCGRVKISFMYFLSFLF